MSGVTSAGGAFVRALGDEVLARVGFGPGTVPSDVVPPDAGRADGARAVSRTLAGGAAGVPFRTPAGAPTPPLQRG